MPFPLQKPEEKDINSSPGTRLESRSSEESKQESKRQR